MKNFLIFVTIFIAVTHSHAIEPQQIVVRQMADNPKTWELVGLSHETGAIQPMTEDVADRILKLSDGTIYKCDAKFYHENSTNINLVYSLKNCKVF